MIYLEDDSKIKTPCLRHSSHSRYLFNNRAFGKKKNRPNNSNKNITQKKLEQNRVSHTSTQKKEKKTWKKHKKTDG